MSQAEAYAAYKLAQIRRSQKIGLIAVGCGGCLCLCLACLGFLIFGGYLASIMALLSGQ